MSIIRNRLYQFKQELLSNKDRAWYSHTNLLTAVDLLITDLDNLDESDWIRVNDEIQCLQSSKERINGKQECSRKSLEMCSLLLNTIMGNAIPKLLIR